MPPPYPTHPPESHTGVSAYLSKTRRITVTASSTSTKRSRASAGPNNACLGRLIGARDLEKLSSWTLLAFVIAVVMQNGIAGCAPAPVSSPDKGAGFENTLFQRGKCPESVVRVSCFLPCPNAIHIPTGARTGFARGWLSTCLWLRV